MKPPGLLPDWEEASWKPFRDAWDERGLMYPPSRKQMRRIWPIVRDFPDRVADWVEEAPHETSNTYEIVDYLQDRHAWEWERSNLFDQLTDEERLEWFELEEHSPAVLITGDRMRRARDEGVGLPGVADGENPYRVMLHEKAELVGRVTAAEEAERSADAERERVRSAADAKRPHLKRLLEVACDEGLRLIDRKADKPSVLEWGARTGRLIAAALGSDDARLFLDPSLYRGMINYQGIESTDWPIRERCTKLTTLISDLARTDIRADFDPIAWPVEEPAQPAAGRSLR